MLAMLSSWSNGTTVVPTETFQSRRTSRGDQPTPAIDPPSPTPSLRSSTPFTRSPAQSPDSQSHRTFLFLLFASRNRSIPLTYHVVPKFSHPSTHVVRQLADSLLCAPSASPVLFSYTMLRTSCHEVRAEVDAKVNYVWRDVVCGFRNVTVLHCGSAQVGEIGR